MTQQWGIRVRGPDDLIPVADAAEAHRLAHKFNQRWTDYVVASGLHEFEPHLWATPVEFGWGAEIHAASVREARHGEYAWLWADGMPAIPKPFRSQTSTKPTDGGTDER